MPDEPEDPKIDEPFETSVRSDRPTNTVIAKSQENSDRPAHTDIAESFDETDRPTTTTIAKGQVKSAEIAKKELGTPKPEKPPSEAVQQKQAKQVLKTTQETASQPANTVAYISSQDEPQPFPLLIGPSAEETVTGVWDHARRRVVWYVPKELAERFDRHYQVQTGRIIKVV